MKHAIVLAASSPSALLAHVDLPILLADGRPAALLALPPSSIVPLAPPHARVPLPLLPLPRRLVAASSPAFGPTCAPALSLPWPDMAICEEQVTTVDVQYVRERYSARETVYSFSRCLILGQLRSVLVLH